MSFPKIILIGSIALFAVIGVTFVMKKNSDGAAAPVAAAVGAASGKAAEVKREAAPAVQKPVVVQEIPPQKKKEVEAVQPKPQVAQAPAAVQPKATPAPVVEVALKPAAPAQTPAKPAAETTSAPLNAKDDFPNVDRIHQLFTTGPNKLPVVETVSYTSRVPWLKGRPAWVADYATYYATSRHFIARSLNGKADYFSQKVMSGSRFNVFRKDKHINFHLLIDVSRCKMGFYYVDLDTNERVLLKTYRVGLGRIDPQRPSGTLAPLGKYSLGSKVAIYKPGTMGYYLGQKAEMIQIFGTRWLPFDQELEGATTASKGYGIHGAPWKMNPKTGQLEESREGLGKYDSDGCIRLALEDIEELFSIVITKPTYVEIVKDFRDAKLPGMEVANPTR